MRGKEGNRSSSCAIGGSALLGLTWEPAGTDVAHREECIAPIVTVVGSGLVVLQLQAVGNWLAA